MGGATGLIDAAAARSLAGIAGAMIYVQALGLVPLWFPGKKRGLASGIMHSGNGAGLVLTGLGLPFVLKTAPDYGWRAGWDALALATLAIVPFGWIYCRAPASEKGTRDALPRSRPARPNFVEPVQRMSLAAYGGLYGLFGLSYIVYATFFAEALRSRGLPIFQTGLVWALVGTLSLASGPVWGLLSDRIGRLGGLAAVFGVQAIAYLAFLAPTAWSWTLSGVLFGGTAWGIPAIMAATMGDVGHGWEAGAAFGRVTTVMGIGQAVGPVAAGVVADITGTPSSGLWVSVGAAVTGGLWSFCVRGSRPS
jgi:MFS family permease